MKTAYTPETRKSQPAPKAPMFCGLIKSPQHVAEQGGVARHVVTVVGLFNHVTNEFEVRSLFGCFSFTDGTVRQTEEMKQRFGNSWDGNYLYDAAQQGFYTCVGTPGENQVWAALYAWMDVLADKTEYRHMLVPAQKNGFFDMQKPLLAWGEPTQIPITLGNVRKENLADVLNKFYPDSEEPVWKVSSYHPSLAKKMEERKRQAEARLVTNEFGIPQKEVKPQIRNAGTKLDNRTKQIINNLLRREAGIEVFIDKEDGQLKLRDCQQRKGNGLTDMERAFDAAIA